MASSAAAAPTIGDAPIQLYSLATPNGQKLGIALEELGLKYNAHTVRIGKGDQFTDWFKKVNPNSKIPALVDNEGPGGKPITVFESAAILIYLADKTGKLLAKEGAERYATIQWLFWQMGGVGPMFGQTNHFFSYAPEDVPYAKKRYLDETKRLLRVLDTQLQSNTFISGNEYTIADIATWPWINSFFKIHRQRLDATDVYPNVERWVKVIADRPAVQRGILVCPS